jgi:hypothetical protein
MALLTVRGKTATVNNATVDVARMLDTARFWSLEARWHEHRQYRLDRERDQLELWLTRNNAMKDGKRYAQRSARSRHCFAMARHHRSEVDRITDLLYTLIHRQPSDLQGRMTSIWYASKTQPPPDVRPTRSE